MTHDTMDYEGVIRASGRRVTPQRVMILDAVCAGDGHTTLKQVYRRLHRMDATIDQSSVYRTLKLFVELGLVISAENATGETVYEIPKPQKHHHLVCRGCGGEQEIGHDAISGMVARIETQHGFRVEMDHLVLFGLCAACRSVSTEGNADPEGEMGPYSSLDRCASTRRR